MDAEKLRQAMVLADSYAKRRAFYAAHPFTREKDEDQAKRAVEDAREALEAFLSSTDGVPISPANAVSREDADKKEPRHE